MRVSCHDVYRDLRIPISIQTRWDLKNIIVSTVFDRKDKLSNSVFMEQLSFSIGFRKEVYIAIYKKFLCQLMPYGEILCAQLQTCHFCSTLI